MSMSSLPANGKHGTVALAAILAAYACARILEVSSGSIPHLWIVALDVLSAATFAAFDGSRHYRWRTILVFAAICVVVGNIVENLGVATGFPFGRYYFVELMGPKVFHVPVLLGLAYIGMAYVSWMLASLILKTPPSPATTRSIIAIPLLASLIMTTWDLAQDRLVHHPAPAGSGATAAPGSDCRPNYLGGARKCTRHLPAFCA